MALSACGYPLRTMAEEYGEATAQELLDVDWIPEVASRGWVIFSKDEGLKSGDELNAICANEARVFLLPSQSMREAEQIERFRVHRFRIALKAAKRGPSIHILHPKALDRFECPTGVETTEK